MFRFYNISLVLSRPLRSYCLRGHSTQHYTPSCAHTSHARVRIITYIYYIVVFTYIYIYLYLCLYLCLYIHIYLYLCLHIQYTYVCICMYYVYKYTNTMCLYRYAERPRHVRTDASQQRVRTGRISASWPNARALHLMTLPNSRRRPRVTCGALR